MNKRKTIITAFLLCIINILYESGAAAQGAEYRGEIFGNIGVVKIFDDETNLGNGVGYGGGIRFFAGKRLSIRPEFRMALLNESRDYLPGRDIIEPGLWAPRFNVGIAYHW